MNILKALLAYFVVFASCGRSLAQTQALGDLDNDGIATVRDIAIIAGHFSGTTTLTEMQRQYADVNKDGAINDVDMDELVKEILGTRNPETLPLSTIRSTSPSNGEGDVAVTRETIVHFTVPLSPSATLDTAKFTAVFGGKKILSRVDISSDRKKATLFFLESLPSNARIQLTLDGTGLTDLLNRPFDADGDGTGGGIWTGSFDTLSITPVAATAISGRVFASEPATGGAETPLAGVTVTVDGAEETLRAVTDAQGNFTLSPCPAGSFFVHVDGRTSPQSSYPNGSYYPFVGKRWDAEPGRTDNLCGNSQDTSRGTIYLPRIVSGTMQSASQTQDTPVAFPSSVLAANSQLVGTTINVPANSLFSDAGVRGGRVGIAPVAPDRLPSPLPPGLDLPLVITIQTDGASNFDRPVPVCFPNLPDPTTGQKLEPGAKSALWSFNHDLGEWEVVGPMTVTDDGLFVKTDAGVGVLQPGWHGTQPGCQGSGSPTVPAEPKKPCDNWGIGLKGAAAATGVAALTAGLVVGATGTAIIGASAAATIGTVAIAVGLADAAYQTFRRASKDLAAEAAQGLVEKLIKPAGIIITNPGETFTDFRFLNPKNIETFKKINPQSAKTLLKKGLGPLLQFYGIVSDLGDLINELDCQNQPSTVASSNNGTKEANRGNRYPVAENDQALDSFINEANVGAQKFLEGLGGMIGRRMAEVLPQNRSFVIVYDEANRDLVVYEEDGSNYDPENTGKAFRISILSLIDISTEAAKQDFDLAANQSMNGLRKVVAVGPQLVERYMDDLIVIAESKLFFDSSFGPDSSPTVDRTVFYRIFNAVTLEDIQRGKLGKSGAGFRPILQPDRSFVVEFFEPIGNLVAAIPFLTPENSGSSFGIGEINLAYNAGGIDSDADGLCDNGEEIVGTNPGLPDTDGDGISDGAEIRQGTNPLDGLIVATGVIASAPTIGYAQDVSALNNIAATANGAAGTTLFNVLSGLNPVRLQEIDTPGTAVAVACQGQRIAVADYAAGLAIVDISNPTSASITHQVNLGSAATCVVPYGPLALTGTAGGDVVAVDLRTGAILWRVPSVAGQVQDLAVSGETLYAYRTGRVDAISLTTVVPAVAGSAAISGFGSGRRLRLAVGPGVIYASHLTGWNVLDITTDPLAPTVVGQQTTGQVSFKQLVSTGSSLALAAAAPTSGGPHNLDLYDAGANGRGNSFLTSFATPGTAESISIYNGLAYVADGNSGLQVVNYRAYDNLGQAPTISLSSNFNLAGGTAEEGALMRLTAQVGDDVQVRNVEFYVDGALIVIDGNFPFERRFVTPAIAAGKTSFTVRAKATDTGGNATWTDEITLTLVPDATPPQVTAFYPSDNALTGGISNLSITFSEPMDVSSLNGGVSLTSAGPDGIHDSGDDVAVGGLSINFEPEISTAYLTLSSPLEPGRYRVTVDAPAADVAGNAMAAPAISSFKVFSYTDSDGDGVPDDWEIELGLDPTTPDSNNNGIPDGLEDYDNDGLSNAGEFVLGTDPRLRDTNGNGIDDGFEDSDLDGLADGQEILRGTDPYNIDTDGDGWDDAGEIAEGTDPLSPNSAPPLKITSLASSYLNALPQGPDVGLFPVVSVPASYLNSLPYGPDVDSFPVVSAPASYLNSLPFGPDLDTIPIVSLPAAYLNSLSAGPAADSFPVFSLPASYQNNPPAGLSLVPNP